jgi:membrane-associated protein
MLIAAAQHLAALGLDPKKLIETGGLLLLGAIVFAESGLLIGFFLPGDSLLFTAGLLVATNKFDQPIWLVLIVCFVAAVTGDQVGYLFGRKAGPKLFEREDSRIFKRKHLLSAQEFFERHGARTIVLARFVPIVRTFAPVVAGAANMAYRTFVMFNVVGGVLWAIGVTTAGWALGKRYEWLGDKIEVLALVIVGVSVIPVLLEVLKHRRNAAKHAPQQG